MVDSDTDGSEEKDYVKGFAQRATDPDFKERKAKGPFVVRGLEHEQQLFRAACRV